MPACCGLRISQLGYVHAFSAGFPEPNGARGPYPMLTSPPYWAALLEADLESLSFLALVEVVGVSYLRGGADDGFQEQERGSLLWNVPSGKPAF